MGTPSVLALQAARDSEETASMENEVSKNTTGVDHTLDEKILTEVKVVPKESIATNGSDSDDEDVELPDTLKILTGEIVTNPEESVQERGTRSSVHVNTMGLSSSTLDMELHALRNLVYADMFKKDESAASVNQISEDSRELEDTKPEDFVKQEQNDDHHENKYEEPYEQDLIKMEEEAVERILSESKEGAQKSKMLTRQSRFIDIGSRYVSTIKLLRSSIWHQRKKLRLKKANETRLIMNKSARSKPLKPERQDYSLELLCRGNLYDNLSLEIKTQMEEFKDLLPLIEFSDFGPKSHRNFQTIESNKPNTLILKRVKRSTYSSNIKDGSGIVLVMKKTAKEKTIEEQLIKIANSKLIKKELTLPNEETVTLESSSTEVKVKEEFPEQVSPSLKGSDLMGKTPKKIVLKKALPKFKPHKVTWGALPVKETKTPKSKKIKTNSDSDSKPAPKKRGRKPKLVSSEETAKISPKVTAIKGVKRKSKSSIKVNGDDKIIIGTPNSIDDGINMKSQASEEGANTKVKRKPGRKPKLKDGKNLKEAKRRGRPPKSPLPKGENPIVEELKMPTLTGYNTLSEPPKSPGSEMENVTIDPITKQTTIISNTYIEQTSEFDFGFDEEKKEGILNFPTSFKEKRKSDGTEQGEKKKRKTKSNEQLPLKICIANKTPKKGRQSVKLRVKTQTTADNGFKIQINQPKTDNPLQFK